MWYSQALHWYSRVVLRPLRTAVLAADSLLQGRRRLLALVSTVHEPGEGLGCAMASRAASLTLRRRVLSGELRRPAKRPSAFAALCRTVVRRSALVVLAHSSTQQLSLWRQRPST